MEGTVCSLQRQRGVEECIPFLTPGQASSLSPAAAGGLIMVPRCFRPSDAPVDPETPGQTPERGIGAPSLLCARPCLYL